MTAKKTTPTSQSTVPAKIATTIATGSPLSAQQPDNEACTGARLGEASTADVHDFVGVAILIVPPALRAVLGDKHLLSNALELQDREVLVIVREAGVVAYVHLPIIVKEMECTGGELHDGMVLRDITGSYSKAAGEKEKLAKVKAAKDVKDVKAAKAAVRPAKPAGKTGRHA
jgi:hypothetical protein